MSLISLDNLSFRYPLEKKPLWSQVSLELNPQDHLLIRGASGCGKSTLLGVMAGLIPRLTYGKLEGRLKISYSKAALVLQNPQAQLVTPSVFEEVAFALENQGMEVDLIKKKVLAALETFHLESKAWQGVLTLSGGEAQRLSLACAFAQDPEILFLDEPTAYLDPWASEEFVQNLGRQFQDKTLVIVEHRVQDVAELVTKSYFLNPEPQSPEVDRNSFLAIPEETKGIDPCTLSVSGLCHFWEEEKLWGPLEGEFTPGRVGVLMGPTGAGKSTFLKIIAGFLPKIKGTVFLNHQDSYKMKPKDLYKKLLYIPQNPEHFFLRSTLAQEWSVPQASSVALRQMAEYFHLDINSARSPFSLSEGEKRRLTLGLAFLDPRPIILLDEPTYGLDQKAFDALVKGIQLLKAQGKTILLVTHSPELVRACGDDLWFLNHKSWEYFTPDQMDSLLPRRASCFC